MSDNEKKLRTLKDVERFITNQDLGDPFSNDYRCKWLVVEDDLRSCAREWVKELLKNFKKNHSKTEYNQLIKRLGETDTIFYEGSKYDLIDIEIQENASKIGWIKHFFNLEDE